MKHFLIILTLFCVFIRAGGQNITTAEYYFDNDPGYGKGSVIPVTPSPNVANVSFSPSISLLAEGFHRLYVRSKDANGKWSLTQSLVVYKQPVNSSAIATVNAAEYYFDTDPGIGKGTSINIAPSTSLVNVDFNAPVSTLATGFHRLYLRTRDSFGRWSLTQSLVVFKPEVNNTLTPKIKTAEYYFDTDPGFGNGNPISFTSSENLVNVSFNASISSLSVGFHRVYFRTRDDNGSWSLTQSLIIYKPAIEMVPAAKITGAEYYFDTDPGYGSGTAVAVTPGENVSSTVFTPSIAELSQGFHKIYLRTRDENGKWSLTSNHLFFKQTPVPDAVVEQVEYFIDTDPGIGKGIPVVVNPATKMADSVIRVNTTGLTAGSHKFYLRTKDSRGSWSLTNISSFNVGGVPPAPAIVVNKISRKVMCTRDTFRISYHETGTFNEGNVFKVELSNEFGAFNAPVLIGSITDTASGIISCKLPAHVNATSGRFKVRITSTNPVVTGVASIDSFTVNDGPHTELIWGPTYVNANVASRYYIPNKPDLSWSWFIVAPGTVTPGGEDAAFVSWNTAGEQILKTYATDKAGCKGDTATKPVVVYNLAIDSVKVSSLKPCPSSAITVTAKVSGAYDSTNNFIAQLSNAVGSFATPVNIGSVKAGPAGNLKAVSITAKLPYPLVNGNGYRIRVVASSPAVTSVDNGQNIVVNKPNLGADKAISKCAGSPVNLTSLFTTTGLTAVWNTPKPDSVINPGTYQLIVTNANGCKDTALVKVTNTAKPNLGADKTVKICEGSTTNIKNLYSTTGLTAEWSFGNPDAAAPGTYTLIVTNTTGCKDTAVITVAANPKPKLGNDTTVQICAGSTTSLVNLYKTTGYTSVVWSTAKPGVVGAGTYTLTVTNSTGCRDTAVITVAANPKPNLGADTTVYVCQGNTTSISRLYTTTGLGTTQWSTPNPDAVSKGVYTLVVTSQFGCKDTAVITVIENTKPDLGKDTSILVCAGSVTNIQNVYDTRGFESVQWSTATPQSVGPGTYTLYAVKNSGCADTAVVTVATRADLNPTIGSAKPRTFCKGDSVTLVVKGGPFAGYLWSDSSTGSELVVKTAGSYTVMVTDTFGCTKTSPPVSTTVMALPPVPTITTVPAVTNNLCPGTVVTLTSSAATRYVWMTGDTSRSLQANTGDAYIVKAYNANGCSIKSAPKNVTYLPCGNPVNPLTKSITNVSAVASWRRIKCATGYELQYRKTGAASFVTVQVPDTSYNLSNLFAGTSYEWKVRSICSTSPIITSDYTAVAGFTTTGSPDIFRMPSPAAKSVTGVTASLDASVYPNPASRNATLQLKGVVSDYAVSIVNAEGKVLWQSQRLNSTIVPLPVDNLAAGMYIVIINTATERKTLRLVIQR